LTFTSIHSSSIFKKQWLRKRDNGDRVAATVEAYFDFINQEGEAFRLLSESDMAVEPKGARAIN
jgi:hypothetical protein